MIVMPTAIRLRVGGVCWVAALLGRSLSLVTALFLASAGALRNYRHTRPTR